MSTTQCPGRFATLPDERMLAATVTAPGCIHIVARQPAGF
jgi:hypothetical protein